ncbi:MAG: hypothetical protein EAX95_15655 [Candidatus Thorarchaeota archaeon]|nr:hypothetical protein [Candidatus Thorarchaeota archaeon]
MALMEDVVLVSEEIVWLIWTNLLGNVLFPAVLLWLGYSPFPTERVSVQQSDSAHGEEVSEQGHPNKRQLNPSALGMVSIGWSLIFLSAAFLVSGQSSVLYENLLAWTPVAPILWLFSSLAVSRREAWESYDGKCNANKPVKHTS